MATFGEMIYMVLDKLKIKSDDSHFNEDHILFTLNSNRALLLKQKYSKGGKISQSNYQTLCISMEPLEVKKGIPCEIDAYYVISTKSIPSINNLGITNIYVDNFTHNYINYVDTERFKYTGYNKRLPKMYYSTVDYNNYLYIKGSTISTHDITGVKVTAVFNDATTASELECSKACDLYEREYPIEQSLISALIQVTVEEYSKSLYAIEDSTNNAKDDMSNEMVKANERSRK